MREWVELVEGMGEARATYDKVVRINPQLLQLPSSDEEMQG